MPSYQDIETRLRVVEDKIDFSLKTFAVTQEFPHPLVPGGVLRETKSLLDLYRQMKGLGMTPDEVIQPIPESGPVPAPETETPLVEIENG